MSPAATVDQAAAAVAEGGQAKETQGEWAIKTCNAFADGAFMNEADPSISDPKTYKYAHYLPTFDKTIHMEPLAPFEHRDPALSVPNPLTNELRHLLQDFKKEGWQGPVQVQDLTPKMGTEIRGIELKDLDEQGRAELGALVARRKIVIVRDQPKWSEEKDLEKVKDFGRTYGRLHVHPTSGHPEGHPEFHLVYRDATSSYNFEQSDRVSSVTWHSDVTYELQPPGTSFFWILDLPVSVSGAGYAGGDTVFCNMVEAYNRLSEPFKQRLEGLEAVHSGVEQADYSRAGKRGGVVRRDPVENVHPVVRTHPVTGERALFVNPQFTRRIVGYKREESEYLLKFLFDHIAKGIDFHARVQWTPDTVSIWDNRVTCHTAILDFESKNRRHASRLTPQAERPFYK